MGLVAGGQFLPGKLRQTGNADKVAVTGPVFFAQGDFLAAHGTAQGILAIFGVLISMQNKAS